MHWSDLCLREQKKERCLESSGFLRRPQKFGVTFHTLCKSFKKILQSFQIILIKVPRKLNLDAERQAFGHRSVDRCVLRHISNMNFQCWAILGSWGYREKTKIN